MDENEKKTIEERSNDGKSTVLVTIKKFQEVVDKDIVEVEQINDISVANSVTLLGRTFFEFPRLITESYLKNYCALSSACVIKYGDDGLYVTDEYEWKLLYENSDIAYKTFTEWGTFYYVSEDGALRSQDFVHTSHPGFMTNILGKTMVINGYLYKYIILAFPLLLVIMIVLGIVFKKRINEEQSKLYKYSLFLFGSAAICLLANVFVGLFIDRYAIFAYPSILLGICGLLLFIISLFTNKNTKETKKKESKKAVKKNTKNNKKKDK